MNNERAASLVTDALDDLSTPAEPWTNRDEVRAEIRTHDGVSHEDSKAIAGRLESFESAYVWFGYVLRRDPEVFRAAIEQEHEGEFAREVLIGQLNRELQAVSES